MYPVQFLIFLILQTARCHYVTQTSPPLVHYRPPREATGCILPVSPDNGKIGYINARGGLKPGDKVPEYTMLRLNCHTGFTAYPSQNAICETIDWSENLQCVNNLEIPKVTIKKPTTNTFGCALPENPLNGNYSVSNYDEEIIPGNIVTNGTVIWPYCDDMYDPNTEFIKCNGNNKWSSIPICHKKCKIRISNSVNYECYTPNYSTIQCGEYSPHGTKLHPGCKDGHFPTETLSDMECKSGRWTGKKTICKPDCGYEKSFGISHIVNGVVAKTNSFPWHVGIYQKISGIFRQICGGTLLHTHIVIGAAHCFFNENRKVKYDAEFYRVAAGKYYSTWDHPLDSGVQISEVKKIIIPEKYRGDEQNHQNDIAILVLEQPFHFHDSIHPACYDLSMEDHNTFDLRHGSLGKVAGWGFTETGRTSEELRTLNLPVVRMEDCTEELKNYNFNRYLTLDKFCAGYLNESSVCKGDSGGGLVFPTLQFDVKLWYLRGIVSNGPLADDRMSCRSNTYTAFTNVFYLREWIFKQFRHLNL